VKYNTNKDKEKNKNWKEDREIRNINSMYRALESSKRTSPM